MNDKEVCPECGVETSEPCGSFECPNGLTDDYDNRKELDFEEEN